MSSLILFERCFSYHVFICRLLPQILPLRHYFLVCNRQLHTSKPKNRTRSRHTYKLEVSSSLSTRGLVMIRQNMSNKHRFFNGIDPKSARSVLLFSKSRIVWYASNSASDHEHSKYIRGSLRITIFGVQLFQRCKIIRESSNVTSEDNEWSVWIYSNHKSALNNTSARAHDACMATSYRYRNGFSVVSLGIIQCLAFRDTEKRKSKEYFVRTIAGIFF